MTGPVLVTGAQGFVGSALVKRLLAGGATVRVAVRRKGTLPPTGAAVFETGAIGPATDWRLALQGIDAVVHCAARVHQLSDDAEDPLSAFRAVNRDGTEALARQAAAAGARRFVFISSIGVNGAETFGRGYTADDRPAPHSPYAVSKHEGELALWRVAAETGLGVSVVRPPLVYGPRAPGNFAALLRAMHRAIPLPLGAIHNRRSFVALDNLTDLIALLLRHDKATGKTWLVSDGEDLSTTELLRRTAQALGRPARLIPVPAGLVRRAATLLGRPELGQRLCGSLEIDISATRAALNWKPPFTVDEALVKTAQHFLSVKARQRPPPGDNQRR